MRHVLALPLLAAILTLGGCNTVEPTEASVDPAPAATYEASLEQPTQEPTEDQVNAGLDLFPNGGAELPAEPVDIGLSASGSGMCWKGYTIPATVIPATDIPATDIPATDIPPTDIPAFTVGGKRYPAQHIPGSHIPGSHIPGSHIPATSIPAFTMKGGCLSGFAPSDLSSSTVVADPAAYIALDSKFAPALTSEYWHTLSTDSLIPDFNASGFGGINAAGFPKNQFVRSYFRSDGSLVSGYWRNSSSDGLPTCKIIRC